MKKLLIIIGGIALIMVVAAGAFWGGMTYQTNRASQVRSDFFAARGLEDNGQFPGGAQGFPGGRAPEGQVPGFIGGGGIATGEVKAIEGDILTLSTAQDVTTVNLSETTSYEKSEPAGISDLQPGMRVTVTGPVDSNGEITATQILILDTNASDAAVPPGTGMEP
jgi:hypothetical protein